jgi:hypothetical protein
MTKHPEPNEKAESVRPVILKNIAALHMRPVDDDSGGVALNLPQRASYGVPHMPKTGKDWHIRNDIAFGKEYIGGRIDVAVHCKAKSVRRGEDCLTPFNYGIERFSANSLVGSNVDQNDAIDVTNVQDRCDGAMFIRTIERVHCVKEFSVARWVCRKASKQVLDTLRGCFHSTHRGFEI